MSSKSEMVAQEKKWKAESDMRSLVEAARIMADPERKKAAMDMVKKEEKAIKAVASKS